MALEIVEDIFIEEGESLSSGADCTGGEIVRLTMSEHWTPANITFQISSDGKLYNDLVNVDGQEFTMPVVPGSAVVLGQYAAFLRAIAFLKIRSGTRQFPVPQEELRSFAIALEVPDDAPVSELAGRKRVG
jgi:hypothetical protein